MRIHVPEDMGGKLKVLPEVALEAKIQDLFSGKSKTGNPKVTVKWVITEECSNKKAMKAAKEINDLDTCIGENVLETFSLMENAMWNLNDLFQQITGSRIPMGDFSMEEFEQMLKNNLIGGAAKLSLVTEYQDGKPRTNVSERGLV